MTFRSEPTPPGAGAGADAPCDATVQTVQRPKPMSGRDEDPVTPSAEPGMSRQTIPKQTHERT
jgi:hypothetical protein